jgi:magnesium and cobalt transporter
MSAANRGGLLSWLQERLFRRAAEPSLRSTIAGLVQEAADAAPIPGHAPELDRQERALLANVLHLRGTTADDVMVPRADIVAMRVDATLDQAIAQFRLEGHSRLPVFREQLDDIVGMVHLKDVFAYIGRSETFQLENILRRPLMVAPQIPVLDLLLQMRQARMHMALVVDEYGGIDGLVTIEDLVETITGDIADEHDEVEGPLVTERADGALDMDGRLPIEELETRIGPIMTEAERDADIDTVGGLVFTLAGRVPAKGEVIGHPSGLEFRILDADARRIRRLRVRRAATPQEAAAQSGIPARDTNGLK